MFGDVLVGRDGTEHDTSTALAGKTVGIYFSAHWCPPCRQFTPAFARAYEKLTGEMGKNFEVIFVSSDRDERAFDEYRDEMPWLAMPFRDRELKAKLSKTFKVTGIPSLVVLDETGSVITTDGRRVALDVEKFPWTPPGVDEVLGDAFVRNDAAKSAVTLRDIISTRDGEGSTHNNEDKDKATKGDKYVGIYFSAHWCGPCRQFTPKLKAAYESLRARGIDFEVIFVSSDRSEEEFTNYQSESMPDWLAVPFNDAERRAALA
jgi:nucleoredoxin